MPTLIAASGLSGFVDISTRSRSVAPIRLTRSERGGSAAFSSPAGGARERDGGGDEIVAIARFSIPAARGKSDIAPCRPSPAETASEPSRNSSRRISMPIMSSRFGTTLPNTPVQHIDGNFGARGRNDRIARLVDEGEIVDGERRSQSMCGQRHRTDFERMTVADPLVEGARDARAHAGQGDGALAQIEDDAAAEQRDDEDEPAQRA